MASRVGRRLMERISSLNRRLRSHRWTVALAILSAGFALVIATPGAIGLFTPDSDGLFYEVQKLEVEGHGSSQATEQVFSSPLAREVADLEDHDVRRVLDPAWVDYSSQFDKRRRLVPAFAASIDPLVGHDTGVALRVPSAVGYVLLALSITRDSGMIVLLGVLCLTLVERRDVERLRTNLLLPGTGVAAALPAFLLGGAPVRRKDACCCC
jgi:hypothetical protein